MFESILLMVAAKVRVWDLFSCLHIKSGSTLILSRAVNTPLFVNHYDPSSVLQILGRCVSILLARPVLPHVLLAGVLVRLKELNLLAIHMLHHVIRLPLLEAEAHALVAVVLIVGLILVILDLDEVRVDGYGVKGQRDQRVDGGCLGDPAEGPALLVAELDQVAVVDDDLVALVLGRVEQLGQREPLARHLVPVVGVHELVVVHAVRRVPLHPLHRRLAAVQRDDVVQQPLPRRRDRQRLGRVRLDVLLREGLARLELLAREGRVLGEVGFACFGGHLAIEDRESRGSLLV